MPEDEQYSQKILNLYGDVIEVLKNCKISQATVDYRTGYKTPRRPSSAHSNFLINRQLGDWTERLLRMGFNQQFEKYKAVQYGVGNKLVAGDKGFVEMFKKYHEEISTIGKRPDVLIFDRKTIDQIGILDDISEYKISELSEIARKATQGWEVRSSRYKAAVYRKVKQREQSFTPKLEDLPILTHWIAEHNIPCFYVQVFFDEVHIISFEKILKVIKKTGVEFVKKVERNQGKTTFYIPLTEGRIVGELFSDPKWEASLKIMADGRVIIYATPSGGRMRFKNETINSLGLG